MATIHVDGKDFEVDGADNLLQACLSLGLDIPYFCWHPALGSVGACRQCAVKQYSDETDKRGQIDTWLQQPGVLGLRYPFLPPHMTSWPTDGTIDWLWPAAEQAVASWVFRRERAERAYLVAVFTSAGDKGTVVVRPQAAPAAMSAEPAPAATPDTPRTPAPPQP